MAERDIVITVSRQFPWFYRVVVWAIVFLTTYNGYFCKWILNWFIFKPAIRKRKELQADIAGWGVMNGRMQG